MSIPLYCSKCGTMIGTASTLEAIQANREGVVHVPCPNGTHTEPVRVEKTYLFGLLKRTNVSYPETHTSSSWHNYTGPRFQPLALIAILVAGGRMLIDGKWCYWDWSIGFYGDGAVPLGVKK